MVYRGIVEMGLFGDVKAFAEQKEDPGNLFLLRLKAHCHEDLARRNVDEFHVLIEFQPVALKSTADGH